MSGFQFTRPNTFPPIVKNLIIINVLVYMAQLFLPAQYHVTRTLQLYPIMPEQLHEMLVQVGFYEPGEGFKPYQIATHLFAHSPQLYVHILFNMFALFTFGRVLENVWGPKRFLLFYFICGVGAAALHLAIQYYRCDALLQAVIAQNPDAPNIVEAVKQNPHIANMVGAVGPALGASGAIMGLFIAFGYLFPNSELYFMFIPIPIKAKWAVLIFAGIDLFGGLSGTDNVAHFAHLGGALTGFILVLIWTKWSRKRFY